jgi:hypothetical protein
MNVNGIDRPINTFALADKGMTNAQLGGNLNHPLYSRTGRSSIMALLSRQKMQNALCIPIRESGINMAVQENFDKRDKKSTDNLPA